VLQDGYFILFCSILTESSQHPKKSVGMSLIKPGELFLKYNYRKYEKVFLRGFRLRKKMLRPSIDFQAD